METPNSRRPRTPRRGRQLRRCPTHAPDLALLDQPLRGRPTLRQHPRHGLLQTGHGSGPAEADGLPHVPNCPTRPTLLVCQRAAPYGRGQRCRVAKFANVHFHVFVDTPLLQQGAPLLRIETVDLIYYCVMIGGVGDGTAGKCTVVGSVTPWKCTKIEDSASVTNGMCTDVADTAPVADNICTEVSDTVPDTARSCGKVAGTASVAASMCTKVGDISPVVARTCTKVEDTVPVADNACKKMLVLSQVQLGRVERLRTLFQLKYMQKFHRKVYIPIHIDLFVFSLKCESDTRFMLAE